MQRLQAFKFELRPNGAQERNLRRFAGACRFVYNEALALQKARYERGDKSFRRHEARLRHAQRALSRKVKFSQNWKKAKARIHRIHVRISNARGDYLHKATSAISKNHATVCIEDLRVKNMSRSTAGTAENPGRNVRAKAGLNKSILDQGWFEFRRQLEYKLQWAGGRLIAVPPQNTSQRCPMCRCVSAANRLTQAKFRCVQCLHEDNADVVGAKNILARGYRVAACGEAVSRCVSSAASSKQEPAEATECEATHV